MNEPMSNGRLRQIERRDPLGETNRCLDVAKANLIMAVNDKHDLICEVIRLRTREAELMRALAAIAESDDTDRGTYSTFCEATARAVLEVIDG